MMRHVVFSSEATVGDDLSTKPVLLLKSTQHSERETEGQPWPALAIAHGHPDARSRRQGCSLSEFEDDCADFNGKTDLRSSEACKHTVYESISILDDTRQWVACFTQSM